MKAKTAVATVSGKDYYLIVDELKKRNIPFLSLNPYEPIPVGIKVVITTEKEKSLLRHEKVLVYKEGDQPEALINEALKTIQGRGYFEKITIGVDPGEVFGLAVLADGKVIKTENCFSVKETLGKIQNILKNIKNMHASSISVKVGDGVPQYKEKLLCALDEELPSNVALMSVEEAGTDRCLNDAKHRRGLRDIVSAIQIAGRSGQRYRRSRANDTKG
jgi:ABC-type sugar transport system ATPase subunit